jgi:hypothetical protein
MATIELNETQLQDLLQLVYLGEWVTQAYGNSENAADLEELEQKIYSVAYNNGIESDVAFDKKMGGYLPTPEFEEFCDEIIEKYDDNNFWEELIVRLANKELKANGGDSMSPSEMEKNLNELIKKYELEFHKNGIDNLVVTK